jgi:hypothetical protein
MCKQMKKLFFTLLFFPFLTLAQNTLPRFEQDTLYTSGGFKIYKGQALQFGKGTGRNGAFRFINIENGVSSRSLQNASVVVKELKNFEVASFFNGYGLYDIPAYGNRYIEITGTIIFKDGSTGYIDMKMDFDQAIEELPELPAELVVPVEYRKAGKAGISEKIKKLFILYENGAIKKEEFEAIKKKFLLLPVSGPVISMAQYIVPRFEKDTLYTTCGYKIFKGQTLQIGRGTGNNGRFRFINIKNGVPADSLANRSIVVSKLKNFGISSMGNAYIEIVSPLIYKDGSKGFIDIHLAFDNAIENSPELPSELIVPSGFRNKPEVVISKEINRLNQLYKEGALTADEFESTKKKLLEIH